MAEKVIHEVRVIETDDGFRIEVKGDKERMRKLGLEPRKRKDFWPRRRGGKRCGRRGHRNVPDFARWAWPRWDN